MQLIAIGTRVRIGGDISATVTGISIFPEGTRYEVVWWDGRSRKIESLAAMEVEVEAGAEPATVGFHSNRNGR